MRTRHPLIVASFLIGLFSVALPAAAQTPGAQPYTLEEIYRSALRQGERIGIAAQSLEISRYDRERALSLLQPRLSAFGSYRRYKEEEVLFGSTIQPRWENSYGVKAEQSVTLNGRELTALRIAEQGIAKNEADVEAVTQEYLFAAAQSYYDVVKIDQAVAIANANVRRLQTHRASVERRLQLAEVPKTELFRTQAELAKGESDLIQAQNALSLAKANLVRLTGLPIDFELLSQEVVEHRTIPTDLALLKENAFDQRAELKSLAIEEEIASRQIDFEKGAYWPRLGVEGVWMRMDQSPDPLLRETAYVAATVTFDFYDGGLRSAQVAQAKARRKQAELVHRETQRRIALEVEQAWRNWNTQEGLLQSSSSQLHYARENFNAVTRLFAHGLANSVDVMDANTVLVTAERQHSEAEYNLRLAALALDRSQGVHLEGVKDRSPEGTGSSAGALQRGTQR
jgi:outer membrane protein